MARKSAKQRAEELAVQLSDKQKPENSKRGGYRGSAPPSVIDVSKVPSETLRKIIGESAQLFNRPPCKDDTELTQRLVDFFHYYANNDVGIPTVEKMCLWLGTTRDVLYDWQNGSKGGARADVVKNAKQILAAIDADLVLNGHINPVAYIFRAKNYYGLKDQQDVVVQAKNIFGEGVSREEIERRLMEDTSGKDSEVVDAEFEVKD